MASFVYAPEVKIHIATAKSSRGKGKVIDVSEDCTAGFVTRVVNGLSITQFTLLNQSRKYDGMFSPMDRVTVKFRRLKQMQKFSGYLDGVPLWQAEPGSIRIKASCSLKRLANFMWDPTSPAAVVLLNTANLNASRSQDGGLSQKAINLLTKVGGWPEGQIHIARIPSNWYETVSAVADKLIAESEVLAMANTIGTGSWIGGANPLSDASATVTGNGPGTGSMPATSGKCSSFAGVGNTDATGNFALTGEPGRNPRDNWYIAMRWPYVTDEGRIIPGLDIGRAKSWWANRKILIVNPKTNKAVVARAADWGPNIRTGRVIDLAPQVMRVLGASTDDTLHMGFAPSDATLGPVKGGSDVVLGSILGSNPGTGGTGARGIKSGWGAPGDRSNIVTAQAAGITFHVHQLAKANFEGFVNDLVSELGYHPKSIGGFNDRVIANTSTKSNHAWGAAIDIDPPNPIDHYTPGTNPRYDSGHGGAYALPKPPAIIKLARKWGLYWGGEYSNSKDYMHFEVIGAPSTPAVSGYKAGTGAIIVAKWKPPVHGVYHITNRFGATGPYAHGHSGVDYAAPTGTSIYPVGSGAVHDKGFDAADYGNWVSIDMGGKVYTQYAHMNAPTPLAVGARVDQDTVIGHIGMTGNTSGPHVHVELRKGDDSYSAALKSGGIDKYTEGGAGRTSPPAGTDAVQGDYGSADANSPALDAAGFGQGLFNVFQYNATAISEEGSKLGGYRALLNDTPLLTTVSEFMQAGMRDYCSAPNGDFISWFPDYFGHYGQAGKMVISDLEIVQDSGPPTIGWDDTNLRTHQFVTGATSPGSGDATAIGRTLSTAGIASIEFPELMMGLFRFTRKQAEALRDDFLERFGARPEFTPMNYISGGRQEFFFACYLLQQNWSQQYQASVNLTFMPELFPGMLACFPTYGIQGYIRQTTDSWDMISGFSTEVSAAPWSSIGDNPTVAPALPRGAAL